MTHTLQIDISDSLYDTFIAFIQNLPPDIISVKKISTSNELSEDIVISSKDVVRKRVYEAEKRIKKGDYLTQNQYDNEMNDFFRNELGIERWRLFETRGIRDN